MIRSQAARTAVFALLLACLAGAALGQSRSGTILGTVRDASGGVIPGAEVTIIHQETNISRVAVTDDRGRYQVPLLPLGKYTLRVAVMGFRPAEIQDVVLELQANREVNFSLVVGGLEETVTVSGEAVEIERNSPTLGQVIHERQVSDLPLNGRNFVQLGHLTAGVTKGEGSFYQNSGNSEVAIRGSVSLSAQGMRENSNDWLLDGIDNNELTAGAIAILPSIDAVKEFKVLTYNYSAEYGSRAGATVIGGTKSGSNEFHGSLFEYHRNDVLDARNFFDGAKKAKYIQNQLGGSLGGPVIRNKTFFFGDFQGTYTRRGLTYLSTVPTAKQRAGDFTESFPDAPMRLIYNPNTTRINPTTGLNTRDPFPGNIIPPTQIDPIGKALLELFPLPNTPGTQFGNYLSNPVRTFDQNSFNIRIDHTFSDKDSLFVRFSFDDADQFFPTGLPGHGSGPSGAFSTTDFTTDARNIAISETHFFSPNAINQVTVGFNRVFNRMKSVGFRTNLSSKLGIPGANLGDDVTSGLTNIFISGGFNRLGDRLFTPFMGGTNVYHFSDNFSLVRGSHSWKFGGNIRYNQMNTLGNTWFNGQFSFDQFFTAQFGSTGALNSATGHALASLLMGIPTSGARTNQFGGFVIGRFWDEYRVFAEDTWRVSPNLTLNLGLAYHITTPQREDHDRFANFIFETGQLLIAGKNAGRTAGVRMDKNNFQPRIGFAWSPGGNRKTVIRGGYGIFNEVSINNGVQGLYQNIPFTEEYSFTSNNITPVRTLKTGFPAPLAPTLENFRGNLTAQDLDYKMGFVQQWNLNLQRELPANIVFSIAYAGSKGTQLFERGRNLNTATPGSGFNPSSRRPYPQFNNISNYESRGKVDYHSLQVRGERRFTDGLFFLLSYTWSKSLGNGNANLGTNTGVVYYPLLVPKDSDKGFVSTDVRHNFTGSFLYHLPVGRGKRLLSDAGGVAQAILGDWQVNSIVRVRTGYPLPLNVSSNQSGTGLGNRPNRVCDGQMSNWTVQRFFDTSCFANPVPGVMGNSSRTPLSGPGLAVMDLSLFKDFPVGEKVRVQFRSEFFNLLNSPQFDAPGTTFGNPNFGRISSTVGDNRVIQFALRLTF